MIEENASCFIDESVYYSQYSESTDPTAQTLKNEDMSISDINFTAEMDEEEETKTTSIKNDALLNERKAMVGSKSALGLSLPDLDDVQAQKVISPNKMKTSRQDKVERSSYDCLVEKVADTRMSEFTPETTELE